MRRYAESTIGEAWRSLVGQLSGMYDPQEAIAIGREVFLRLLHIGPDQRVIRAGEGLDNKQLASLEAALDLLKEGMPMQYITGVTSFLDLDLEVRPGVLIPRPETQELVLWAVSTVENTYGDSAINILDVGTGSGCIAISLAKLLDYAQVYACDISDVALEVARKNARNNRLDIRFFYCDVLDAFQRISLPYDTNSDGEPAKWSEINDNDTFHTNLSENMVGTSETFECIISNPPYVRQSEKIQMKPNVHAYEPGIALFVDDDDPLKYYRAIGHLALKCLQPGGMLFFEVNEALGLETLTLLEDIGFMNVRLKKDIHGKDRFVMGQRRS